MKPKMKPILKSLLLFSTLAFGLETMAISLGIQQLKDGALSNIQKIQDGTVEVIDTMEFSGSVTLVESEGEKDVSIDTARAQIKIPISNNMAVLLQADARQAYGRNLETSEDDVDRIQDKLKNILGLSVAFDVDVNNTPVMILVGKFDHVNFPLLSLSPHTAEEDELAVERGATGARFVVKLPLTTSKYIAETVLQGTVLNRSEDRDISNDYFHNDNVGYNVSLSHSFLKYSLGISHTSFDETAGVEENVSLFGSYQFNPKTGFWGRFTTVADESGEARPPESESLRGIYTKNKSVVDDQQTETILSLGVNHEFNSQISIFGRFDYVNDGDDITDNERASVGAILSSPSLKGANVGVELYNRDYENSAMEDETSMRTFVRLNF